jgi:hypothetical protein
VLVGDLRRRLVAHGPAGVVEPPHQIDVLPDGEGSVEAADAAHHVGSGQQGGRGHVADAAAGSDPGGASAHVEGGARRLVPAQESARARRWIAVGPERHDSGRDRGDGGIGEVGQERVEPSLPGLAVGVDEGDQRGGDVLEPGRAGAARTALARVAHDEHGGAVGGPLGGRHRFGAGIVDDDDRRHRPHRAQQVGGDDTAHRDDDGDVLRAEWRSERRERGGGGPVGVDDPRIEQAAGEGGRTGPGGDRLAAPEPFDEVGAGIAEAQHPHR